MPIVPDTKDWTWVLERPCPECGFDTRLVTARSVPARIRDLAGSWSSLLAGGATGPVRARPREDRWSPLEYACHVRDVFVRFNERLLLMLEQEDPTFPNWDQDAAAVEGRYAEQLPLEVAGELMGSARALAGSFEAVPPGSWGRTGTRSDGARFSIESLARYLVHDPVHHLYDVGAAPPEVGYR